MDSSFLILGLGNPGKKYKATRHNIGFMVVDQLAKEFNCSFRRHLEYEIASFNYQQKTILLMKPTTYMNLSGQAVVKVMTKNEIDLANFLVIVDDLNLPLAKLRIRPKGSAGGHKGLKSIIENLGTDFFPRLRIGIGGEKSISEVSDYVLTPFQPEEMGPIAASIKLSLQCVLFWIEKGIDQAMNEFNREYQ